MCDHDFLEDESTKGGRARRERFNLKCKRIKSA